MQLPELPREKMRWDEYQAFHWIYGGGKYIDRTILSRDYRWMDPILTVFDTGEVIVNYGAHKKRHRGHHPEFGIETLLSNEMRSGCLHTPDGREVPKRWLSEGGQTALVIDHHSKRVVSAWQGYARPKGDYALPDTVPARFRKNGQARAYIPGPDQPPIGMPIGLSKPLTTLDKEQVAYARTQMLVFRTALKLSDYTAGQVWEWRDDGVTVERMIVCQSIDDLTHNEKRSLVRKPYLKRPIETVPYLVWNE